MTRLTPRKLELTCKCSPKHTLQGVSQRHSVEKTLFDRSKSVKRYPSGRFRCVFLGAVLALACATNLPNVQPFVDASEGLSSTVKASGTAVEASLREVDPASANQLHGAWAAREEAVDALVTYSLALQDITNAGNTGSESVEKLATATTTLADQINVALPAQAISTATDIGKFIYGQIARARAAKKLSEALEYTHPAVARIAELLAADVRDLDGIVRLTAEKKRVGLELEYNVQLRFRDRLLSELETLYGVDDLTEVQEERLLRVSQLLAATEAWYRQYRDTLAIIDSGEASNLDVIHRAAMAVGTWGRAHGQVALAVAEGREVRVDALFQAATEAVALAERVRANIGTPTGSDSNP